MIVTSNAEKTQYLTDEYFCKCKNDQGDKEIHINADSVIYGQFYYLRCPECTFTWNTGDHISTALGY